jgi:hypothetical protein
VSLFLLKESDIHTISVLIYSGMRDLSVRSVPRLAVDSVHIVHKDAQVSVVDISAHTVFTLHIPLSSTHL